MGLNTSQMKALLYKEYLTYKKNLVSVVFVQLAIPITLCYLLLVYIPSIAEDAFTKARNEHQQKMYLRIFKQKLYRKDFCDFAVSTVYFHPKTNETVEIMNNVKKKCKRFDPFPIELKEDLDKKIADIADNRWKNNATHVFGAIIFNNLSEYYLDYELRPVNFRNLNSLYNKQKKRTPFRLNWNPYLASNFVSMQIFVNEAFLETNKKTKTLNGTKSTNKSETIDEAIEIVALSQMNDIDIFAKMPIMDAIFIYYSAFISTVLPMMVFLKNVLDEKNSEMKKLLKLMAMNELEYWLAKCFFVVLIFIFLDTVIVSLVRVNTEGRVDVSLLFTVLLIYFLSSMFLAMALSTFFNAAIFGIAAFLAIKLLSSYPLWYFLTSPGHSDWNLFQGNTKFAEEVYVFMFVVFPPNYSLIASLMLLMEGNNYAYSSKYLTSYVFFTPQWSHLFVVTPPYRFLSLGVVMSASLVSGVLWFLAHLLLSELCKPDGDISRELDRIKCPSQELIEEDDQSKLKKYFESEPSHLKAGIVIKNLTKKYTDREIVKNLSLNIYFGQITVLLGHNGAGKTTMMNMITGLTRPSSGSIYINGCDVTNDRKKAVGKIGLCPQKEILFENFTVEEHLYIFAILKGFPLKHIKSEIARVLQLLNLTEKQKLQATLLSGGMRRKLQFGISIVGGCNILILDEPSSGLDVESRRLIWDLLRSLRRTFLIFMTTHHMEEADCLADRIVIMADGKIKCNGSTPFLKRIFSVGHHLRILTELSDKCAIQQFVAKHCNEAKFEKETSNEIVFSFPLLNTETLQTFYETLEKNSRNLGVRSFGLTMTSLDDVFLNSYHLFKAKKKPSITDLSKSDVFKKARKTSNSAMICALFLKRLQIDIKRWKIFVSFIAINILFTLMAFYMIYNFLRVETDITEEWKKQLNYTDFEYKQMTGFCSTNKTHFCNLLHNTATNFGINLTAIDTAPEEYMDNLINRRYQFYRENVVLGFEKKNSQITVWHLNQATHSLPIGLNIAFNFLLKQLTNNSDATIRASIHTLSSKSSSQYLFQYLKRNIYIIPYVLVYSLLFAACFSSILLTSERSTKAILLQYISGVTPLAYWATSIVYDILYLTLVFSPFWVITFSFSKNLVFFNTFTGLAVFISFVGFLLSSASLNFLVSQIFSKPSTAFVILFLFNAIPATVFNEFFLYRREYKGSEEEVPLIVEVVVQLFELGASMSYFWLFVEVVVNSMRATNSIHLCSALNEEDKFFIGLSSNLRDCNSTCNDCYNERYNPFRYEDPGVLFEIIWIYVIFIGSAFISFILELRWFHHEYRTETETTQLANDYDVKAENEKVDEIVNTENNKQNKHLFLCHRLSKTFKGVISFKEFSFSALTNPKKLITRFVTVNNLSFSVQKNEFFGFLGVNGAGKTTTFRMLTGDLMATAGNAYLSSFSLRNNFHEYQQEIGYCPQQNVLLDCLTGRQTFEFFAKVRGISSNKLTKAVNDMLQLVDLEQYSETTTTVYSGGNMRKLALGIALIGCPSILMLDEPTSGVDPFGRRKLWKAIENYKSINSGSVILSSHSLDECEALCNRIAILAKGTLKCIGSIQHLKSKFCPGYIVNIKLNRYEDNLKQIDSMVKKIFHNATVIDEHYPLIVYQLPDAQLSISTIFQAMETIKKSLNFEEYQVSQMSLEQLFLAFSTQETKK